MSKIFDTTSANAQMVLTAADLFPTPVRIEGFKADGMFTSDPVESAETEVGVDGYMSAGFINYLTQVVISLQAGSPSHAFFETLIATEKSAKRKITLGGLVFLPSQRKIYTLQSGVLATHPVIVSVGKVVQGRDYVTRWQDVTNAPV